MPPSPRSTPPAPGLLLPCRPSSPSLAPLLLRLTGAAALLPAGAAERPLDPHGALLAARLALAGPQPRALLATWLWPDVEPARARGNLRQRLLRLKALAGCDWIVGARVLQLAPGVVRLLPDADVATDLLEDLPDGDGAPGGAWLQQVRQERRARQLQALVAEARQAEREHRLPDALAAVRRLVAVEPQVESHQRQLMRLHYLAHDVAAARAAHAALCRMLRDEFAAEPGAATRALFDLICQARPGELAAADPVDGRAATALQRPPRMVGRAAERATLAQWVHARAAVLLLGEAGMGKSRLLAEALHARRDVVAVKASAGDADVPYATLARLLDTALQHSGRPAPPGLAPWLPAAAAGGADHPAVGAANLAASAASEPHQTLPARPLPAAVAPLFDADGLAAVVVDDLHFADDASIEMLQALAARPVADEPPRVAWLFAQRSGEGSAAARRLREVLAAAGRLAVLTLRPLDVAQMAELVGSLGLPDAARLPSAAQLVQHTGGNPLFALETLKQRPAADASAPLPEPLPVRVLIERRLQGLSAPALALARTAAVAGPDFGAEMAAAVVGRPLLELADAWAELEAAQVLRDHAFAHDLVLEAAQRSVPPAIARPLHAAVAGWLEARHGEPARVAAHWLAAGQPPQAARWLRLAADRAHHQLRPREEAGFLAQWVECVEADDRAQAVDALLRLVRVQTEASGFAASAALLQRALPLVHDDAQRLRLLNLIAETELNQLLPGPSARAAEEALALAQTLADAPAAAEARVRWHRALCMGGHAAQAEALWQALAPAPALLPTAELVSDRGWVLDRLGRVREARAWHDAALRRAQASGRPVDEAVVLGNLAQSFLLDGQPAQAECVVGRAEALGNRHDGLHSASDYLVYHRASAAAAAGRYGEALAKLERALADTPDQSAQARLAVLCQRALLWAAIGQHGRAQADAARVLAEAGGAVALRAGAHLALALAGAAAGLAANGGVVAELQQARDALADPAQAALDGPIRLRLWLADAAGDPAAAPAALAGARQLLRQARANGQAGQRWLAHWVAAQLAVLAGRRLAARRHAAVCAQRPAGVVAPHFGEGSWWHGLWQVWRAVGDLQRASTALAAGRAWVEFTREHHLPAPWRAGFADNMPAHAELLASPEAGGAAGTPP